MWAIRNLDEDSLTDFIDDEFFELLNKVANDLNVVGSIHVERYYGKTTDAQTNYDIQGEISKVLWFKYESDDWEDQYWTFILDKIVLKEAPDGQIQMDIEYVRKVENVALTADEIDLPEIYMHDFIDLVKRRMLVEFGKSSEMEYEAVLKLKARSAPAKRHHRDTGGTWRHWFIPSKGDDQYDITENWISQDYLLQDVSGDYYITLD